MTQYPDNNPPGFGAPANPPPPMGHNPYQSGGYGAPGEPAPKNTVGLVGFIVSLASIVTCGVLAPIGVLISFIGLFKRPRGFAIAGVIVGIVLSAVGALMGLGIVMAMLGIQKGGSIVQQGMAMGMAEIGVQQFYAANGRLPDDAEFDIVLQNQAAQVPGLFGGNFQVDYRYEPIDATNWRITMPGFDGVLGTGDDINKTYSAGSPGYAPPYQYPVETEPAPDPMDGAPVVPDPAAP